MSVQNRIAKIKKGIFGSVLILAATKGRSLDQAKEAIDCGITVLGENYVQEAEKKYGLKKERAVQDISLHLIGHLQKNKVKKAVEIFDLIQSVDSFELAVEISKRADFRFPILIQVNIGREPQKSGCDPDELISLVEKISELEKIKVMGLMAMAPNSDHAKNSRPYFAQMRRLFEELKEKIEKYPQKFKNMRMEILSMGMSHDYKIAIEEGATMVRIGSSIFGERN